MDKFYQKVSYFSTIPAPVRYSNELSNFSKLLYGEITCLTNAKGYCYAMNNHLASLYKVHKNTISNSIKELEKAGFIKVEYIYKNKVIVERRINLLLDTSNQNGYEIEIDNYISKTRTEIIDTPTKNCTTPHKKQRGVSQKIVPPPTKNCVDNVFNNVYTNVNNECKEKNITSYIPKEKKKKSYPKSVNELHEYFSKTDIPKLDGFDTIYIKPEKLRELELNYGLILLENNLHSLDDYQLNERGFKIDHYATLRNWITKDKNKTKSTYKPKHQQIYVEGFDNEVPF